MRALVCGLLLAATSAFADVQECAVLERQMNQRAGQLARSCHPSQAPALLGEPELLPPAFPSLLGTTDHDVIAGGEGVYPHVTQSETQAAMSGTTRVIAYNDSSNAGASPRCYAGGSVSRDSGATWTKLPASAFCSGGHGDNFGDPFVLHDNRHAVWVAGFIVTGCGAQGLGAWRSGDGVNWNLGSCIHIGTLDDRESAWGDNQPTSPFYGRLYVSWNAFGDACPPEGCDTPGGGHIFVTHSDDGGVSWTLPVQVEASGSFIRNVQITVGTDGHVFIAGMDEGAGGLDCRQNHVFRSADGGNTWADVIPGPRFMPPGTSSCGYFAAMFPAYWRHMGWGDVGAAGGIVHYAFASGRSGDLGDVYYIRSADNGVTWADPVRLNSDTSGRAQWQPSLAVSPAGHVFVSWYDARNTIGTSYERWGRLSTDGGLTWSADQVVSDAPSPLPGQPDPNVQPCYAGDYDRSFGDGSSFTVPWVDGRVPLNGAAQQDVFADVIADTATSGTALTPQTLAACTTATTTTTTLPSDGGCNAITPIPSDGGTFTGSTNGGTALFGSCGGAAAPEQVFAWTPNVSGVATIATCGGSTNYDTVLYLRQNTCQNGAEVACNDDACTSPFTSFASRITPTVTAGVPYFVVVDGFATSSGTFTLTVTPPGVGTTTTTLRSTTTTSTSTSTSTSISTTSTTLDPCIRNPHPRRCRARVTL